MEFDEVWICWVMKCIATVSYSVLVKGSPQEFFKASRELRQGGVYTYLFILISEVLTKIVAAVVRNGQFIGRKSNRTCPILTNMFLLMTHFSLVGILWRIQC